MKLSFHGADREVTGSCHLIECAGKKILIDCGLYQGSRELTEDNSEEFDFDASSIDFLLLTHAHLDHCGRIPLLVKRGFRGEIITTGASRELAKLVMLDAAHLQEEEAKWQARRTARHNHKNNPESPTPLYSILDTLNSLDYFGRNAKYGEILSLTEGIEITFFDAGHILGSASILLKLEESGYKKQILFSGDLGYNGRVILRNPAHPPEVDVVVMETTYGDRLHKQLQPSIDEFYEAVCQTFDRGGNVIIPSFALERTQELLYFLREGKENGKIPGSTQVFLDSPMAISATEIFRRHSECYDAELNELLRNHQDPFDFSGLHFTRETAESMSLNQITGGAVIIAGSGMCTGGRIRHHLKQHLWRENSSIIFVGYAASGTLARHIVDGAKRVQLFGKQIHVRAHIHTIGGFSAHADSDELFAWHQQTGKPQQTFLVHGEENSMATFASRLKNTEVIMPKLNEVFTL